MDADETPPEQPEPEPTFVHGGDEQPMDAEVTDRESYN
jgi:hypothetical protein